MKSISACKAVSFSCGKSFSSTSIISFVSPLAEPTICTRRQSLFETLKVIDIFPDISINIIGQKLPDLFFIRNPLFNFSHCLRLWRRGRLHYGWLGFINFGAFLGDNLTDLLWNLFFLLRFGFQFFPRLKGNLGNLLWSFFWNLLRNLFGSFLHHLHGCLRFCNHLRRKFFFRFRFLFPRRQGRRWRGGCDMLCWYRKNLSALLRHYLLLNFNF